MKLNPKKCIFIVLSGKQFGFIISEWGIKADSDKINDVIRIGKPKNLKGVQKLAGCVSTLSWFIS